MQSSTDVFGGQETNPATMVKAPVANVGSKLKLSILSEEGDNVSQNYLQVGHQLSDTLPTWRARPPPAGLGTYTNFLQSGCLWPAAWLGLKNRLLICVPVTAQAFSRLGD